MCQALGGQAAVSGSVVFSLFKHCEWWCHVQHCQRCPAHHARRSGTARAEHSMLHLYTPGESCQDESKFIKSPAMPVPLTATENIFLCWSVRCAKDSSELSHLRPVPAVPQAETPLGSPQLPLPLREDAQQSPVATGSPQPPLSPERDKGDWKAEKKITNC